MPIPEVARQLQEITERINPVIERAEQALVRAGLTFPARVPLSKGKELGFDMVNSLWRLQVWTGCWNLLRNSSRETRLEALRALPRLEKAIREAMAMTPDRAASIIKGASSFVEELETEAATRPARR